MAKIFICLVIIVIVFVLSLLLLLIISICNDLSREMEPNPIHWEDEEIYTKGS